jgi:hypothetical protein
MGYQERGRDRGFMVKKIIILLVFLCSCTPFSTALVPISIPCPSPGAYMEKRPALRIASLKSTDTPDIIVKSLIADIDDLKTYSKYLESLLSVYEPK